VAYATLSLVRHAHYGSFGFDLGIADQVIWEYSTFHAPITTIDHVPFISELFVHLEFIYILVAPFYWLYNSVATLIVLQAFMVSFSGIPIYLLARKYKLSTSLCFAILISYLSFYGVQNALWFDAHSAAFGTSFLAWFIYFLDKKQLKFSLLFFFLTILCKENYAAMTLVISIVYYYLHRDKKNLIFIGLSLLYLLLVFGFYYPHIVPGGYRFQSKDGLLSDDASIMDLANTDEKRQVLFYTFAWTGFLSFLQPIVLLPLIGNLITYFILGRDVSTAQGLFLQYRIELDPLLFWATIYGISKYKALNKKWLAIYLFICVMLLQYALHLPLSYLTKRWFWEQPKSVQDINTVISYIPPQASIVSQNNIIPHISHRYAIFTLWPSTKTFTTNSPCNASSCQWFTWSGKPQYLITDTAKDWDIRHFLADREKYIEGLKNLEKAGYIRKYKQQGDAILYTVIKNP
jgi:uncharacterized membrane protein